VAAESSFDIVSDFDRQELVNAVDQAQRELATRYDLKDTGATIELSATEIVLTVDNDMTLRAVRDLLESKAQRRKLSLKIFDYGKPTEMGGLRLRQVVTLRKGIDSDQAKAITRLIREKFPKVQPRIQGDAVRVAAKSRDELQAVIALLREREGEIALPLQFTNYR
jgi:uncharacterized protein YajQ (UPF0234 family)